MLHSRTNASMTLDLAIREALAQGVTGAEISQMVAELIGDVANVPELGRTDVAVASNTAFGAEGTAEPGQGISARLTAGAARRVESAADIVGYLDAVENAPQDVEDVIYKPGELPPGLIDLPSAARKYGIKVGTLRQWVHVGKLPRMGRLRAPAAGGGYIVTEEAAIPYCRDHPRKRGPKVS